MEDEIKSAYSNADVLTLPSMGGIFDVEVDGKIIFSKYKENRFPYEGEILSLFKEAGY